MKNGILGLALILPEIRQTLGAKDYVSLKTILKTIHPIDLADGWRGLSPEEQILIFSLLESRRAVEVFEELDFHEQFYLLTSIEEGKIGEILKDMSSDEKTRLFHRLPNSTLKKLTGLMRREEAEKIHTQMKYPPKTAGNLMNTDFVELKKSMTANQALERVQASARMHRMENIYAVYVTDEEGKLIGGLTLRRLIAAPQDIRVGEIMSPIALLKVKAAQDQEDVAKLFSKYDLLAAPVVDDENRLLGIISIDDIVDVIHQEATEDIAKMGGTRAEELFARGVFSIVKVRMPWLFATFLGGLVTSGIMWMFHRTLSETVAIASFIPVVLGMGNNIGVQSATIIVRSLALGRFDIKHLGGSLFKEFRVAILIGLVYGVLLGLVALTQYRETVIFRLLGLSVGLGIWGAMTAAGLIGLLMPVGFYRSKIDPAVASGPFVATLTDIVSLTVYLAVATLLLL